MAAVKVIKTSTLCMLCKKAVSHNINEAPHDLCWACRKESAEDDVDLFLWDELMKLQKKLAQQKELIA